MISKLFVQLFTYTVLKYRLLDLQTPLLFFVKLELMSTQCLTYTKFNNKYIINWFNWCIKIPFTIKRYSYTINTLRYENPMQRTQYATKTLFNVYPTLQKTYATYTIRYENPMQRTQYAMKYPMHCCILFATKPLRNVNHTLRRLYAMYILRYETLFDIYPLR